jgi:SPP1 family predicted phage head-tail adaptor
MRAGELNRLATLILRSETVDELNRPVDAWTKYEDVWVDARSQTGMGVIRSAAEGVDTDQNAYSFRMRYRTDILKTDMRLVLDGAVFDINSIRHDLKDRDWTDLVCRTLPGVTWVP